MRKAADVLPAEVVTALTPDDVELVLLGSAALGTTDPARLTCYDLLGGALGPWQGSDLDLLAVSATLSADAFFQQARKALPGADLAADAAVPVLRLQTAAGVHVEVQFAHLAPPHVAALRHGQGSEALEALLYGPHPAGLAAALDASALLRLPEAYRHQVVAVKRWARRRQLLGTPFGFPGGFAWALLVKEAS